VSKSDEHGATLHVPVRGTEGVDIRYQLHPGQEGLTEFAYRIPGHVGVRHLEAPLVRGEHRKPKRGDPPSQVGRRGARPMPIGTRAGRATVNNGEEGLGMDGVGPAQVELINVDDFLGYLTVQLPGGSAREELNSVRLTLAAGGPGVFDAETETRPAQFVQTGGPPLPAAVFPREHLLLLSQFGMTELTHTGLGALPLLAGASQDQPAPQLDQYAERKVVGWM